MSEIHPGVIIGDREKSVVAALSEAREYDRLEHEAIVAQEKLEEKERTQGNHETETLMLATFLMLPFKESATPKVAFKPVSDEEKRKGAALYAQHLVSESKLKEEHRNFNTETIRLIISFQEKRPQNPCSKQTAFDYWARRMLLERVRR